VGKVEDTVFGGAGLPYRWRYLATFPALALTAFIAVGIWFLPRDAPPLPVSLIGAVLFGFSLYANRVLRRRAAAER